VAWERLSSRSLPHRRRGSGRKPLLQKPSFCRSGFSRDHRVINVGQLPAVALLEPHGATRRRRRPLSFSDHSRTCAGPFSTLQRFLSLARCRIAQMALRRILPLDRRHLITQTQISDPVSLRNVYPGWPESTFRVYPFTILINCLTNLFNLFHGDRSGKAKQLSPRCALRSLLKHCFHIFKDLFLLLF
jgi:hypothetical protein